MKLSTTVAILAPAIASAHYTFPSLIIDGQPTTEWQYVRQTENYQSNGPVTDVSSNAIRCFEFASRPEAETATVAAGAKVGFVAKGTIYHPGPLQFYMAKVPEGESAATWDASGDVWFKILGQGPTFGETLTWPSDGAAQVEATIPASLPAGEYLIRVEHIGLHGASAENGAQFYISCGQINVTGGGSGSPAPLVAFPGAYKATDPGIMINIYNPVPTEYVLPGPAVWEG
ncbi:hypothetical protein FQN50_007120 [Emmonsiellopsis sp. PD_5]|nr:hypothetical protein FQN50_007120 [Emmonsiellopsis sp. PD_5]